MTKPLINQLSAEKKSLVKYYNTVYQFKTVNACMECEMNEYSV